MAKRTYWLGRFTVTTWQKFLDDGASVCGIRETDWDTLNMAEVGDYLLCYATNLSRFVGILEVTQRDYKDTADIWDPVYPSKLGVRVIVQLTPETAVPILLLQYQLSISKVGDSPLPWKDAVRRWPSPWIEADGEAVVDALLRAKSAPPLSDRLK
ncbi:MAG TPA: hypothetical protein VGM51_02295 [Armatimonadota bacterium]|jgi:hypothetical protein